MAHMIPQIDDTSISNLGESIVYRELRDQLPSNWRIRFHFSFCKVAHGYLRDGEADFIVIAPRRGIIFLEVKSSHGYDCVNGVWYRLKRDGRRESTTNPFEQVCRVKHEIVEKVICPRLGFLKQNFPGIYGHAVIYPKAKIEGRLPSSQEPQVLIAYRDMHRLHERLEELFDAWGPRSRGEAFTKIISDRTIDILQDSTEFIAVAAAQSDDVSRQIEQLTRQQYDVFAGLLVNRRAVCSGRAGSGKTMLALWAARAIAKDQKVLFLCFNRVLAAWLQQREEATPNLTVATFHSLCARFAERAGLKWAPPRQFAHEFWSSKAPNVLADALGTLDASEKYDAVFVDEGQDFHPNWWIPVELLLRQEAEGRLYIFHDPDQAVQFQAESTFPSIAASFRLEANCRNTKKIARYCGRVASFDVKTLENAPEGATPIIEAPIPSVGARADRIRSIIADWLNEGYRPSRIAVLAPQSQNAENSSLSYLSKKGVGTIRFESDSGEISEWLDGKVLWMSTIKKFKGLEADCIIVSDLPSQQSEWFSYRDLYVAVSRARHNVVILPSDVILEGIVRSYL